MKIVNGINLIKFGSDFVHILDLYASIIGILDFVAFKVFLEDDNDYVLLNLKSKFIYNTCTFKLKKEHEWIYQCE